MKTFGTDLVLNYSICFLIRKRLKAESWFELVKDAFKAI
jgi:hypothetical protein